MSVFRRFFNDFLPKSQNYFLKIFFFFDTLIFISVGSVHVRVSFGMILINILQTVLEIQKATPRQLLKLLSNFSRAKN